MSRLCDLFPDDLHQRDAWKEWAGLDVAGSDVGLDRLKQADYGSLDVDSGMLFAQDSADETQRD